MALRKAAPESIRRSGRRLYVALGARTAPVRPLPDFVVIGAQRCGTTSLFRALIQHPDIVRPTFHKGVNYFDIHYLKGLDWYRGHFPIASLAARRRGRQPLYFDASGYYMYHPFALSRMARDLPDVRVVVMLRDPVERAYSAFEHERARAFEWEDFATALALEDERLIGEVDRMRRDPTYESFSHRHHSYRHRGDYLPQLTEAISLFGADRVHAIDSHRFFAEPAAEFAALMTFLGLPAAEGLTFDQYNARPRQPMDPAIEVSLRKVYSAQDDQLTALMRHRPSWLDSAVG